MSTLYTAHVYGPTAEPPTSQDEDKVGLRVDGDFAADPALSTPRPTPDAYVTVSFLADDGLPTRATLPAASPALAAILTRRSARVLALGPGAVLPAARLDTDAPLASVMPAYQPIPAKETS